MHQSDRSRVRDLPDRIDDPTPARLTGGIAVRGEFIGPSGALLSRCVAVPPEHQVGGAPDIDLGHHAQKLDGTAYKTVTAGGRFGRSPARIEALERVRNAPDVVQQL